VRTNRQDRIEYYRAFDRQRGSTEIRKRQYLEKQRRKRATAGPQYMRAHNAVARATAAGHLLRPSACSRCGKAGDVEAHHDDHSRTLDVLWLCPVCHAARHKELGLLGVMSAFYGEDPPIGI
jgi:ribosomal protein S27AE